MNKLKPILITITLINFLIQLSFAQKIEGVVLDAITNQPIEFVQVGILGTKIGTLTDRDGMTLSYL